VHKVNGFTIMELMIAVSIIGIIAMIAVPNMRAYMDKHRVISAAEAIYQQLIYARSEAISRSQNVVVRGAVGADTSNWAVGVSTNTSCNPTLTDASTASACVLDVGGTNVLKRIASTEYPGVTLNDAPGLFTVTFDPTRGTIAVGENGTAYVRYGNYELRVIVSVIGRARICAGGSGVRGYSPC